jgi:hypothetical protein
MLRAASLKTHLNDALVGIERCYVVLDTFVLSC